MDKSNNIWNRFAEKHPSASKWIREGGLFVIVSNLITVLKYVMLLFLPLGVFLPILYAEFDGIRQIALCAFALSLAIELMQMFGLGITDVNDLMTNTAGACLGFFLYRAIRKRTEQKTKPKLQAASLSRMEVLLLTASVFLSMMVFAPAWLR